MTTEEKLQRVKDLRPIDDVFFEVLASNIKVCQEILRTILDDDKLIVNDVIPQSSERNIYGRSVRLDALCTLGDGTKCNIEVQRSDNDNHLKRARFNAASITVRESSPGDRFDDVVELYIVYISEFDFLQGNLPIYHIDKVIRENGQIVDDGLHEIFVNTVVSDGSNVSNLMACFTKREVRDARFPELSAEVQRLKSTEGGVSVVSKVMEKYISEAVSEAEEKTTIDIFVSLVKDGILTVAEAAKRANLSEEEFKMQLNK